MMDAGRAIVLNTRPVLNFVGAGRTDALRQVFGPRIVLPPSVVREVGEHAAWTLRDFQRRAAGRARAVDPAEVPFVANLAHWERALRQAGVRFLAELDLAELEGAAALMRAGALDPGESEVLAVAHARGWLAVIDEVAGHCQAMADGVAHTGTLGGIVDAVRRGHLGTAEGDALWSAIQAWWDYAPGGALADYLAGRPLWRACPGTI